MKRRQVLIAALFLLLATSPACSKRHPGENAFSQFVLSEDANASITLAPISAEASEATGMLVATQLTNNSNQGVAFPPGYGARAFIWMEDAASWLEIQNEIIFPDVGFELGPSGGDVPYIGTANFASTDTRIYQASSIRVLVQGWLLGENGLPDKPIAAFADVPLPGR